MFDKVLNTPLKKAIRCPVSWKVTLANNFKSFYSQIKTLSLWKSTWFSCLLLLICSTMFCYFPVLSRVSSLKNFKHDSRWKCWQWFDSNFVLQQIIACSKLIMKPQRSIYSICWKLTITTPEQHQLIPFWCYCQFWLTMHQIYSF